MKAWNDNDYTIITKKNATRFRYTKIPNEAASYESDLSSSFKSTIRIHRKIFMFLIFYCFLIFLYFIHFNMSLDFYISNGRKCKTGCLTVSLLGSIKWCHFLMCIETMYTNSTNTKIRLERFNY